MSEIPRHAVSRSARMASLPVGVAGRATLGLGKRLTGRPADEVKLEFQQRTAEQLFRVLGDLKGGAMKLGQALSVFEAAMPEALAAPYRDALTRLQQDAPPLPAPTVHKVLASQLGPGWRKHFQSFNDKPAAAASIGQVHRAVWADGRPVAVKVQYPGAGKALLSDLGQLGRMARLFGVLSPGLDIKPLLHELRERVSEELDYRLEATAQHAFAQAYADDADIFVPDILAGADRVLVSEWMTGTPLATTLRDGSRERARPSWAAIRAVPAFRPVASRAAACRPAPRQLPRASRRPPRSARFRCRQSLARRVSAGHRAPVELCARRQS